MFYFLLGLGGFFVLTAFAAYIAAWAYRVFIGLDPMYSYDQRLLKQYPNGNPKRVDHQQD